MALLWIHLQKIHHPNQTLGMALHGAQAALPQHVLQHEGNLHPCTKEAAELVVLHSGGANLLVRLVYDASGILKKHIRLRLLVLLVLIVACVLIIACTLVIACVIDNTTHLLLIILAVVDGSGIRSSG
jgi:hypothetical protein